MCLCGNQILYPAQLTGILCGGTSLAEILQNFGGLIPAFGACTNVVKTIREDHEGNQDNDPLYAQAE